jgi:glyoxylase I family protein
MTRLACGTTTLKIVVNGRDPKAEAAPGGIGGAPGYRYFTISVDNLDEATGECSEAGYKIVIPPTEIRTGIEISMIEDPDGNWVELLQVAS